MFEKLTEVKSRLEEVDRSLSDPSSAADPASFRQLMKERSRLEPVVHTYDRYLEAVKTIDESENLLQDEKDPEMVGYLKAEAKAAREEKDLLAEKLRILLLPRDPNDDKNIVMEIRAGVGGDEAANFAADLFRMYTRYAERQGWKCELTSASETGLGGFKECVLLISGDGVWSRLKYESGIHRVQRVPETESGGRIHTSAASVAVMPEADQIDVDLDMNDCRFDVFRAHGNGGQCVNTTDSAVRLVHIPTGIVISCQDEKSQLKNRDKALRILRSKLFLLKQMEQQESEAETRRNQIGSGDRSEKIRTYNFPQGRVTDHRIHLTVYRIDQIMDGDLDQLIGPLLAADQAEKLVEADKNESERQ